MLQRQYQVMQKQFVNQSRSRNIFAFLGEINKLYNGLILFSSVNGELENIRNFQTLKKVFNDIMLAEVQHINTIFFK